MLFCPFVAATSNVNFQNVSSHLVEVMLCHCFISTTEEFPLPLRQTPGFIFVAPVAVNDSTSWLHLVGLQVETMRPGCFHDDVWVCVLEKHSCLKVPFPGGISVYYSTELHCVTFSTHHWNCWCVFMCVCVSFLESDWQFSCQPCDSHLSHVTRTNTQYK